MGKLPIGSQVDGAHVGFRGKSPAIMGRLRRESFGKNFFAGLLGVAIEATDR